jgi:hypothetical protein
MLGWLAIVAAALFIAMALSRFCECAPSRKNYHE